MNRRPWPSILLGGFILVQLGFLAGSNLMWLVRRSNTSPLAEAIALPFDRYAEATGQVQGWSQYSPRVPHQSTFVEIEGRSDGAAPDSPGGERRVTDLEPANPRSYVQWPGNRLACYESYLVLPMWTWSEEPDHDRVLRHFHQTAQDRKQIYFAYRRWRERRDRIENPSSATSSETIFWARIYTLSNPGQRPVEWSGPERVPFARVRKNRDGSLELETFHGPTRRFIGSHVEY